MSNRRVSGVLLIAVSVLAVVVLAHHPTASSAAEMASKATADRLVHGAMLVVFAVQLFAYVDVCGALGGLSRASVRAGAILATLGLGLFVVAVTIDGFALPRLAEHGDAVVGPALPVCGAIIVAASTLGTFALAAAFAAWSIAVLRHSRALGIAGLVVALAAPVLVASGVVALDAHGVVAIGICQLLWNAGAGGCLLRARAA